MNFYLIDWFAFLFTFLSIHYLGKRKKSGFIFGMLGYICWIIVNIIAEIIPGIILGFVMIWINLKSFRRWKRIEAKIKNKKNKKKD
ncbi:nicotinamide mononucleotide transporter [Pseudomonadota bacterium]